MGNTYGMEVSKETQNNRKRRSTRSKKQSTPENVQVAVPVKNVEIVKQESDPQEAEIVKKEPVVVGVKVKKKFCGDLFKNSYNVMLYDHHVRKSSSIDRRGWNCSDLGIFLMFRSIRHTLINIR